MTDNELIELLNKRSEPVEIRTSNISCKVWHYGKKAIVYHEQPITCKWSFVSETKNSLIFKDKLYYQDRKRRPDGIIKNCNFLKDYINSQKNK